MDELMDAVHAALEAGMSPDEILDIARQIIREWEEAHEGESE
jgi:hypothetical protein